MTVHAGVLLRAARTAKGLRQLDVARDAGMSASLLSVLENGQVRVRPWDAARLAPALGLDPGDLLRAPAPPPPGPPQRAAAVPPRSVAHSRTPAVTSFRDIPATCLCDWRMVFERRRPSGWELAKAVSGCPHHGNGARP